MVQNDGTKPVSIFRCYGSTEGPHVLPVDLGSGLRTVEKGQWNR